MTRQEAMKRLNDIRREKANSISAKIDELDETEGLFKDIDALDIALAYLSRGITKNEWIKTSERLPEKYVYVLLYVNDGEDKYITFGYYQTYNDVISEFLAFDDEYLDASKVLYWMPLPEPPKGE